MPVSNLNFAATVEKWALETEQGITAVFRESAQDVIEIMQEPGPSKAAAKSGGSFGTGRMPVDLGFLRASLVVQLNADPPPANRDADGAKHSWNPAAATLVINQAQLGDRITCGYAASYAPAVNYGTSKGPAYHFLEYAVGQWQQIVNRNAERVKGEGL